MFLYNFFFDSSKKSYRILVFKMSSYGVVLHDFGIQQCQSSVFQCNYSVVLGVTNSRTIEIHKIH